MNYFVGSFLAVTSTGMSSWARGGWDHWQAYMEDVDIPVPVQLPPVQPFIFKCSYSYIIYGIFNDWVSIVRFFKGPCSYLRCGQPFCVCRGSKALLYIISYHILATIMRWPGWWGYNVARDGKQVYSSYSDHLDMPWYSKFIMVTS